MKTFLVAGAACALALGLSGCSTAGQQALSPITQAVAAGLPHCHVSGSVNGSIGGLSAPNASNNFTFDCPAQPWANAAPAATPAVTTP